MAQLTGITQRIRNGYEELTAAERRICDCLLQKAEEAADMTAEKLAQTAGTAKSAVVRCCRSLGFEGFSDLKKQLIMENARNAGMNYTPYVAPQDTSRQIFDKVFAAAGKTLRDTAENLDFAAVQAVCSAITTARTIYIYGIGTSALLVNELQYHLIALGFMAIAFTDVPTMKVSTMNLTQADLAIAISYSGRTIAVIETLQYAKTAGAAVACITANEDSPLMHLCKPAIAVYSDEIRYPIEPMSARIAQISLINALVIMLSAQDYERTVARSRRQHELIDTVRWEDGYEK